jgi:hypothetical protein
MNNRIAKVPMIREVTQYSAPDGKVFPSEQQAQRHADDLLCNKLEALINLAFPTGHRPSTIKAVELLAEDRTIAVSMLRGLLDVLTYGDE